MEIKEAIQRIDEHKRIHFKREPFAVYITEALEIANLALEKQVKKPIIIETEIDREFEDYICPNCKNILQQKLKCSKTQMVYKYIFCHHCGQALGWDRK